MLEKVNHAIAISIFVLLAIWIILGYIDSKLTFRHHAKWVKITQPTLKALTIVIAILVFYGDLYFLITAIC